MNTYVAPVLTYGAEAWYPGLTKAPSNRGWENLSEHPNTVLPRRYWTSAQDGTEAVFLVWRTAPSKTLYRDAGILTAEVALDVCRMRMALRTKDIDENHLLVQRIAPIPITRGRGAGGL